MDLPIFMNVRELPERAQEGIHELADLGWITAVWLLKGWVSPMPPHTWPPQVAWHLSLFETYRQAAGLSTSEWNVWFLLERLGEQMTVVSHQLAPYTEKYPEQQAIIPFYQNLYVQIRNSNTTTPLGDLTKIVDAADDCFVAIGMLDYGADV